MHRDVSGMNRHRMDITQTKPSVCIRPIFVTHVIKIWQGLSTWGTIKVYGQRMHHG